MAGVISTGSGIIYYFVACVFPQPPSSTSATVSDFPTLPRMTRKSPETCARTYRIQLWVMHVVGGESKTDSESIKKPESKHSCTPVKAARLTQNVTCLLAALHYGLQRSLSRYEFVSALMDRSGQWYIENCSKCC